MAGMKKVFHIDKRSLTPRDVSKSGALVSLDNKVEAGRVLTPEEFKSVIGRPKVYDLKGNLLAEEENLVVLTGREFLAQVIANVAPAGATSSAHCIGQNLNAPITDYTGYKITHFGIGDGGSVGCPPKVNGPYDDDCELYGTPAVVGGPSKIGTPAVGSLNYIDAGYLKAIEFIGTGGALEGSIEVMQEEHTINVGDRNDPSQPTGQIVVQAWTAIKFTMQINPDEPIEVPGQSNPKPFRFNEAALYAVKYDANGDVVPDPDDATRASKVMFARFTTMDKWLDAADGILIEWYILV